VDAKDLLSRLEVEEDGNEDRCPIAVFAPELINLPDRQVWKGSSPADRKRVVTKKVEVMRDAGDEFE
jgi:hypothetical protein